MNGDEELAESDDRQVLVYSYLSCSLPLSQMARFPLEIPMQTKQSQDIGSVILSASFEISDELLCSEWIESGVDITTLAIDNIFKHILASLHNAYRSYNIIRNIKQLYRQNYSDFKRFIQDKRGRQMVHYVSRSTNPKVQESFVFYKDDAVCTATCINISEIVRIIPDGVFILDINFGGNMINRIKATPNSQGVVAFAATQANQKLPYLTSQSRLCPTDIFSLCMLQPLLALLLAYVQCFQAQTGCADYVTFYQISKLYDEIVNQPTLHSQLQTIYVAVSENVAYASLSKRDFQYYYMNGRNLRVFIRNFFAAQRVLSVFGARPSCTLDLPDASSNALWSQLDVVLHAAVRLYSDITFINKYLDAFELQISFAHSKPTNLPIILQMMRDRYYQYKCYYLIVKYVDYSPDNLQEVIDLGLASILFEKLQKICANRGQVQNSGKSNGDLKPNVFYLLSKCFQHSASFVASYIEFCTGQGRSLSNTIELQLFAQLQSTQRSDTEIIVRYAILQILTILCSQNLLHCFRDSPDFTMRTYPYSVRRELMRDRKGQCIQPLLRLAQSASCQIRVWALLLLAELMQMLPVYSNFNIVAGKDFIDQKKYLELYNYEAFQMELQDIILQLTTILKKDQIPEVRAAAARAVKCCFPDLALISDFTPPRFGEASQDMVLNYYDASIFKVLCYRLLYDASSLVRYDCLLAIIQYIISKFSSVSYQYAYFLAPQFQKLQHRNCSSSYSDRGIQLIISSLEQSAYDPNSQISVLSQAIIKNLKSYAVIILLQQSKLNKEFFTFDYDLLYEQQLGNDEKYAKKYELTKQLFDERELSYVQQLGTSINSLEFHDLYKLLEKNLYDIYSSQYNNDILSFSYRDYVTDKAVGQTHPLQTDYKTAPLANVYTQLSPALTSKSVTDSRRSSHDQEIIIEGSSSELDDYDDKPRSAKEHDSKSGVQLAAYHDGSYENGDRGIISQQDLLVAQKSIRDDEKAFSYATSVKFQYLKDKLQQQYVLDSAFLTIAHCIFANKLYLEVLNLYSPIFYIALQSIYQPRIQTNLQAQAMQIANKSRLVVRGCSYHNQLQIQYAGVFVNRPNDFRCYLCDNICPYGTKTKLSETILKSFSHTFSLTQQQRAYLQELAPAQAGYYQYSFVYLMYNCIQLCQLMEEKRTTFYRIYTLSSNEVQHQMLPCSKLIREINNEMYNRYSEYPYQDAIQSFVQHILRRQCNLQCCQSFIFSFPVDNDMYFMVYDGIPLTIYQHLPDNIVKARDGHHFQQFNWYQLFDQTYSCNIMGNNCILQDGDIYTRNNTHWKSYKTQQSLYPTLNLLYFLELNKGQGNLSDLQYVMEATELYVALDQSCELCRRIAVKVPLLQQTAKTLGKRLKDQKSHIKFTYVPTRDLNPLLKDESRAGIFKKKQPPISSIMQQKLIQQFSKHLAAPFPQLDYQFYCDSTVSKRFHAMFGRSLYRIIYDIDDNLFSFHRFTSLKSTPLSPSIQVLNRIDSQQVGLHEFARINSELRELDTRNRAAKYSQSQFPYFPSLMSMKSAVDDDPCVVRKVSENAYEQATFDVADCSVERTRSMFSEQFSYLRELRSHNNEFISGKKELYDQFKFPDTIKFARFHPILPFMFVGTSSGINVYSLDSRIGINVISTGVMDDYQNNQLYESSASHQHHVFPSSLRQLHQFVATQTRQIQPIYASYLWDQEILAQDCPVCKSIAITNDFDTHVRNYDLYDKQCCKTFDQMSKYQNYEVGDLSQFFYSDSPSAKFQSQNAAQWEPFDISHINQHSTYQLLGVSCTDGCYRILSNPFDINTTRQVASFRVFQQYQQYPYDVLQVLPVFDMMGRIYATQQQRKQQNTYFHYIKSRLQTCALEMQETVGQAFWQTTFMTSVCGTSAAFARDSVKVFDMQREVELFEQIKLPSNCTALAQNDTQIAVAHGGFLQIIDKRAGKISHSESNPADFLKFQNNDLVCVSSYGKIVHGAKSLQYKALFSYVIDDFAVCENGNLCSLERMKEHKIKVEGQQVVYRDDARMCCSYDADRLIRIYSIY